MRGKVEIVKALRRFATGSGVVGYEYEHCDDRFIASALADYIEEHQPDERDPYEERTIHDLPYLLVEAFEAWRFQTKYHALREAYRALTQHDVPDLVDVGSADLVWASLVARQLAIWLPAVTEEPWIAREIEMYLRAQFSTLRQAFQVFARRVWRRGLAQKIRSKSLSGMSGDFGDGYVLRSYILAGRVMLTFAQQRKDREAASVSFIGVEEDEIGRLGVQSCHCRLVDAITLIETITERFSLEAFVASKTVSIA